MTITISGSERDLLYQRIELRLNGIESVYLAVEERDWSKAHELGLEYADLLRFVATDLGWGDSPVEQIQLATPAAVLRRAATTLKALAEQELEKAEAERDAAAEQAVRAQQLQGICERIISDADQRPQAADAETRAPRISRVKRTLPRGWR